MNPFKDLSMQENEELLKFPAYISLLAVNMNGKLDEAEIKSAIKFSHIKTYSSDPLLGEYYSEADRVFENNIEQITKKLSTEKDNWKASIESELLNLEKIVSKLGNEYASIMQRSMKSFKDHVAKAHDSVLADFIVPIPIKGISYQ
jgi:hypothetical protein